MHMTVYNFTINYEIRHTKETTRKRLYICSIDGEYVESVREGGEDGVRAML